MATTRGRAASGGGPVPPEIIASFQKALDAHGYGFQYAVLARARDLVSRGLYWSPWQFEAGEFPAQVQDATTRIDFILRRRQTSVFLVCECKRANPALAKWCFARAPFISRFDRDIEVLVEGVSQAEHPLVTHTPEVRSNGLTLGHTERAYHIGIEVSTGRKGDATGKGRGSIEEAITQVLRGTNGIVELLRARPGLVREREPWVLVPVVFTTAELWGSDVRLEKADLESGKADWTDTGLSQLEWLALNYHVSPGIRHSVASVKEHNTLSDILRREYTRTVFIVSAGGIDAFLQWSAEQG